MAQSSHYSPSPSPGLPQSPQVSDSSSDEAMSTVDGAGVPPASRPDSPTQNEEPPPGEGMECQWEDCGKMFNNLTVLIEHIHNDHIGVHKSNYTCEWKTCPRRGVAQTSRFALISHIRSHTGEKPFICTLPECDKSFTRSDALAKHMRMQHNIVPPAPGRGGNRKRKREEVEPPLIQGPEGYGAFKVEPTPLDLLDERISPGLDHELQLSRLSRTPDADDESDGEEGVPEHLQVLQDPGTGLIMGRTPAMVKYLVMKAKHQHALQEHASLIEELRTVRQEEQVWRERKDQLLDDVLRATFGTEAEELTMSHPISVPRNTDATRVHSEEYER